MNDDQTQANLIILDNAHDLQKELLKGEVISLENKPIGGNGLRNINHAIPLLAAMAASSGLGNHSVSGRPLRHRSISIEERERRKKLKKIAARDRKRNRK